MAVSTRTRFEIFKRDGFRCRYCGADPTKVVLHVDHVIASANGGTDDPVNLVTSCRSCNLGKSDVPLDQRRFAPPSSPEELLEQAEQIRAYLGAQKKVAKARRDVVTAALTQWDAEVGDEWPRDIRAKITSALAYLSLDDVMQAISATGAHVGHKSLNNQSRYFSAVVRNIRIKKEAPPEIGALLEKARVAGFNGFRIRGDKLEWRGPADLPADLEKALFDRFEELREILR